MFEYFCTNTRIKLRKWFKFKNENILRHPCDETINQSTHWQGTDFGAIK